MHIRKVTQTDDFNAISHIYVQSWKTAYKGIVPRQYLDDLSEAGWAEKLSDNIWDSFVAVDGGKYIGTASVCPARDETMRGWGEIVSIYLLPGYFGKGCGKALLDAAVSGLAELGYSRIYLWVLEDNLRARAFYERNGFTPSSDKISISIGGKDLTEMRYISGV